MTRLSSAELTSSALGLLPFSHVFRSYLISFVAASPSLLGLSLEILSFLTQSKQPERNPVVRWLIKRLLYAQFCAGETMPEVQRTTTGLKEMGFTGVILSYAKELVVERKTALKLDKQNEFVEVNAWRTGMLETVKLAQSNGHVALKCVAAESMIEEVVFTDWDLL